MQLNRSLILNIHFGMGSALFISLVRSVLKLKHCSSSKENSTKNHLPTSERKQENRGINGVKLLRCIEAHNGKSIPEGRKGEKLPIPGCEDEKWISLLNCSFSSLQNYQVHALVMNCIKLKHQRLVLSFLCSHLVLQFIQPESTLGPSVALQQTVGYRNVLTH